VPVLEEDDFVLPESAVIMEYLEERYPEPPLWPADPAERAAGRLLLERFDQLSRPYYALRRGDEDARERLDAELAGLDSLLAGRPFLTGREFGLADAAYLPWILRAETMLGVDLDAHPALADWVARAGNRPSVAAETALLAAR
jgi:glutathione S-transferase